MAAIKRSSRGVSTFVLALLLASTPFMIGAKWTQIPIEDFESIAGTWQGSGVSASGGDFSLKIAFQKDGSYSFIGGVKSGTDRMRIDNGVIKMKSVLTGDLVIVTLHENKKGKRILKGRRADGLTWRVKPVKK